jgi:hypothetical protein
VSYARRTDTPEEQVQEKTVARVDTTGNSTDSLTAPTGFVRTYAEPRSSVELGKFAFKAGTMARSRLEPSGESCPFCTEPLSRYVLPPDAKPGRVAVIENVTFLKSPIPIEATLFICLTCDVRFVSLEL